MENIKRWSQATPGYIIFLVDQSESMSLEFDDQLSRAEATAAAVNSAITQIIFSSMAGAKVKNRAYISIIGYGNEIVNLRTGFVNDYFENPLEVETKIKSYSDGINRIEEEEEIEIYLKPEANGFTPMGDAFNYAKRLIQDWVRNRPECPAPIIINISDGEPYDGINEVNEKHKTIIESEEIMKISTEDGPPLIFNVHIDSAGDEYGFGNDINLLPTEQAKLLFQISSKVPDSYFQAANALGFNLMLNSRGFVSNAGPATLIKFISFGTSHSDKGMT